MTFKRSHQQVSEGDEGEKAEGVHTEAKIWAVLGRGEDYSGHMGPAEPGRLRVEVSRGTWTKRGSGERRGLETGNWKGLQQSAALLKGEVEREGEGATEVRSQHVRIRWRKTSQPKMLGVGWG